MSPKHQCTAMRYLTAAAFGALVVWAFAARRPGDEMDLGTVIDVAVIVTVLLATTVILMAVAPLRREIQANRWEMQRLHKALEDNVKKLIEAQPSAEAIAGHGLGILFGAGDDDDEDNVVNLR